MTFAKWRREPLVHFLLAGVAMFVVASWWEGGSEDANTIRLEEEDLLNFMQGRAQVYDAPTFDALLAKMPAEERDALIRDAAQQEMLYREGQALGLAEADPLVRQRVVQQMRLILVEEATSGLELDDADVAAYFDANKDRYATAPSLSFTHVFLRDPATRADAAELLARLRADNVSADSAGQYSQRFLYQQNYVEADKGVLESHFGSEFAHTASALEPGRWQGPVKSQHGWHLVLPLEKLGARTPELADVADQVREDALAERRREILDTAIAERLASYNIELAGDL
ncbi:peptidyl-prolyl cis-trans isomerase [Aurantiacibacter rhizosphaerae]|uniref:Parvulin-like PPIase n=1 Tax=Aurantiacibacter rhizosphaerae TaxID=2691582 RepID=A0A844XFH8_9SPHN|nr:hypothetical protein [Aurantiacibacter rhizosphaerae]